MITSNESDSCIDLASNVQGNEGHRDILDLEGKQLNANNLDRGQQSGTPSKRPRTHSPPPTHVGNDAGDCQPIAGSTLTPQGCSNKPIKGAKTLTNVEIAAHIAKSGGNISIVGIDSDIEGSCSDLVGPWSYRNGRKAFVEYSIKERAGLGTKRISLGNLINQGFPKFEPLKFKWYSWLRFKFFAERDSNLDNVLSSKEDFMSFLKTLHEFYRGNQICIQPEGVEEFKGPQSYDDINNKELLHYYGKGWYKWYKNPFLSSKW